MKKLKPMNIEKIKELYKKGERNFSGIDCREVIFDNLQLEGCDFSCSNLSFSSFRNTNLRNCNFTSVNLEWSNFSYADLRDADFTKANGSYCSFNNANMENAIAINADMSWSLFFNVMKNWKEDKGTNFFMSAWHESELRAEAVQKAQLKAMALRGFLDVETMDRISFVVHASIETAEKNERIDLEKISQNAYKTIVNAGNNAYQIATGSAYNTASSSYKTDLAYSEKKHPYKK